MPPLDLNDIPIMPQDPFVAFDPNNLAKSGDVWATYTTARRTPTFKVHEKRQYALAAFREHSPCKLFELVNGRWEERACKHHSTKSDRCDVCRVNLVYARPGVPNARQHNHGYQVFDRTPNRKLIEPLRLVTVCYDCKRDRGL